MNVAYILPISPIPIIPTVILLSESIGFVIASVVEHDMMLAKESPEIGYRLMCTILDAGVRYGPCDGVIS